MGYIKLTNERKKTLGQNANAYAKQNYKQISLKLAPDVAEKFDKLCEIKGVSRPELLKMMLDMF